jgi:GNAT superfamily N-acetyltransferase
MNNYIYPLLLVINSELVFNTEHTGAKLQTCNRVGNTGQIDTADIQKIKNFFQDTPFAWFVESTDMRTINLLEEQGFKFKIDHPAMHIDLADIKAIDYEGLTIKQVSTDAELSIWIDVVVKSFGIKLPEEYRKYITYLTDHAAQDTLYFYLAYHRGIPVATSMIIKSNTTAALHWIGTLPEQRNQGLGYMITHATLADAQRNGCTDAVLFASSLGRSVYERVGFREYALYKIYVL